VGLIPSLAYGLVVDWRLTWTPVRADAPIDGPSIRAGTIRIREGTTEVFTLGIGQRGDGDRLVPGDGWAAFITVGTSAGGSFTVEPELSFGAPARRDTLVLAPSSRAPFMISVAGARPEGAGTVLVLDGVAATGARIAIVPFFRELLRRIFG
jgi:hypothetical protein